MTELSGPEFTDPQEFIDFALAGKAKFSVKSIKSGDHLTYKVIKGKDEDIWFVKRLGAESKWVYIGNINLTSGFFGTSKVDFFEKRATHFKVLDWLWKRLRGGKGFNDSFKIYQEGQCGKCGLPLTDPESIIDGWGPTCRKHRIRYNLK